MVETREAKYPGSPIVSVICLTHHGHNLTFAGVECSLAPPPRGCLPLSPLHHAACFGRKLTVTEWGGTLYFPKLSYLPALFGILQEKFIYFNRSTWIFVLQFEL